MNLPVRLCDFSDVLSNENGSRARQMPFSVFSQQSLLGVQFSPYAATFPWMALTAPPRRDDARTVRKLLKL